MERYKAGEFGNAAPTWGSYGDWVEAGCPFSNGQFHIRNRVAGGETWYNLSDAEMAAKWADFVFQGKKTEDFYISAMAPHDRGLIQGEIMQSERGGLELFYVRALYPMREAFQKEGGKRALGLTTVTILRHYMNPLSYDWLQVLLSRYPEHVIEFSSFSVEWGTLPGYNTAFWEVRQY